MKAAPGLPGEKVLLTRRQSLACTGGLVELSKVRVSDFTKLCFPLAVLISRTQDQMTSKPNFGQWRLRSHTKDPFSLFGLTRRSFAVKDWSSCPRPSAVRRCHGPGHTDRPYRPWVASMAGGGVMCSMCRNMEHSGINPGLATSQEPKGGSVAATDSRAEDPHFSSDDKHKHEGEHYILNTRANQRTNLDLLRPHATRTCLRLLPPAIASLLTPICIPSNFLRLPPEQWARRW